MPAKERALGITIELSRREGPFFAKLLEDYATLRGQTGEHNGTPLTESTSVLYLQGMASEIRDQLAERGANGS